MTGFILIFFQKVQYLERITHKTNKIHWSKKRWIGNNYSEELLTHLPSKIEDICFQEDIPKFKFKEYFLRNNRKK